MPSTRRSDSIRLDLPLGGRSRYGDEVRPVKSDSVTREQKTLSIPPEAPNPRIRGFHLLTPLFRATIPAGPRAPRGLSRPVPGRQDSFSRYQEEVTLTLALLEQHEPSRPTTASSGRARASGPVV